jgi:hypothetical protein
MDAAFVEYLAKGGFTEADYGALSPQEKFPLYAAWTTSGNVSVDIINNVLYIFLYRPLLMSSPNIL